MSRTVVAWLVIAGCYDPRFPEGAPCTLDRDCPSQQRCVRNACSRGGAPDDASGDAPRDAPADTSDAPPAPCPAFAVLCDDFESGATTQWSGKRLGSGATVLLDGAHAHSGMLALDATVPQLPSSGAGATLVSKFADAQSTGILALREWIYAPQPIIHFDGVIQFLHATAGNYALASGDDNNTWTVSEHSSAGLFDHHSMLHALDSTWVCVEQDYLFAGATSRIQLFVDDQIAIDAVAADPAPAFTQVEVGVARAAAEGFHVFIDDVVVAHQHIGCQ